MIIKRAGWQVVALAAFLPVAVQPLAAQADTVGVASWYGNWHDGLRTSSGETFDQDGMTAASRSLPLGSRVRVTLHETGQSVVVRVNDRMGARKAIIDLSRGAAREIGLLGRGRGMVSVAPADDEPVEVADAGDDATAGVPSTHRGRRFVRRPSFAKAADHRCCRMASVVLARHLMPHHPVQHRL